MSTDVFSLLMSIVNPQLSTVCLKPVYIQCTNIYSQSTVVYKQSTHVSSKFVSHSLRFSNRATNQKVAGLIPGRAKLRCVPGQGTSPYLPRGNVPVFTVSHSG